MGNRPQGRRQHDAKGVASWLVLRLVGIAVVLSLLLLGGASAGQVDPTKCQYGAISAIGPVDAEGRGDTTPEVACITPPS